MSKAFQNGKRAARASHAKMSAAKVNSRRAVPRYPAAKQVSKKSDAVSGGGE